MTEPYLILHKVRGEPAFDIAIRETIAGEETWIIPTSGHRAYPIEQWLLSEACNISTPIDWLDTVPDHYSCNDHSAAEIPTPVFDLLASLGLAKPINRRF